MKKGEKSDTVSDASKEKAMMQEKWNRASHSTMMGIYFDPKNSKLCDQEAVDKYLDSYDFYLNPGIKVNFAPTVLTFL